MEHYIPTSTNEKVKVLCGVFLITTVVYNLLWAIYNLYFHPLRKFPGPKWPAAFPILHSILKCSGNLDHQTLVYHEKYGDVVRISDDELSFINADAWKHIYGHGHAQYPKQGSTKDPDSAPEIITSNDADHARYRKSLAHGFSEKGLRDQEPLIRGYIDLLIEKLGTKAKTEEPTDLVKWYNLTTFDLIGDLAFGKSFDGLQTEILHEWIGMIFHFVKMVPFITVGQKYPTLLKLLKISLPKHVTEGAKKHRQFSKDAAMMRVNDESKHGRGDFMDAMLKHRGDVDGLSDDELASNSVILIIGGSETTATLLSGVTFWLLKTPSAMKRVTEELRSVFERDADINFATATARLPYMLACLDEGLRIYPPVPSGVARVSPGAQIGEYYVPKGTIMKISHFVASNSARNFHEPRQFHPERWLLPLEPDSEFYHDKRAAFQPFSVGPRNCIGRSLAYNEMRLILAHLLWNFDIELCPESNRWAEAQKTFILWDKPPLMCLLKKREPSSVR